MNWRMELNWLRPNGFTMFWSHPLQHHCLPKQDCYYPPMKLSHWNCYTQTFPTISFCTWTKWKIFPWTTTLLIIPKHNHRDSNHWNFNPLIGKCTICYTTQLLTGVNDQLMIQVNDWLIQKSSLTGVAHFLFIDLVPHEKENVAVSIVSKQQHHVVTPFLAASWSLP